VPSQYLLTTVGDVITNFKFLRHHKYLTAVLIVVVGVLPYEAGLIFKSSPTLEVANIRRFASAMATQNLFL